MLRLLLLSAVFACCAVTGAALASEEKAKLARIEGLLSLVKHIKRQVEYYAAPLSDIYGSFVCEALEDCGFLELLRKSGDSEGTGRGSDGTTSFCRALETCRAKLSLDDSTYALLREFGSSLGSCCTGDQLVSCGYTAERLEEACTERREELPKRTKLRTSLGISSGMILVIILL